MRDSKGKLLTTYKEVKKEAVNHYKRVFQDKPMEETLKDLQETREDFCNARIKIAKK